MEEKVKETVLVTGATGFVAGHVIDILLERNYKVIGTVRSLNDPKKYEYLYNINSSKKHNLSLVEANLLDENSWDNPMKGCSYVLHLASPVIIDMKVKEEEIIEPAKKGTLYVLKAALRNNIKKVIVTSSVAAINFGQGKKNNFNENDWSDINVKKGVTSYEKSKYYAEKEVWNFYEENKGKIEIAVINPGLIIGPSFKKDLFFSAGFIVKLMKKEIPLLPKICFGMVDVRDVALAHLNALLTDKSNGQRYILVSETIWIKEMSKILSDEFKSQGYKFPCLEAGYCPLKLASLFLEDAKLSLPYIGIEYKFDNKKSISDLDMKYRKADKFIIEMAYSLIEHKLVPQPKKKKFEKI